MTPVYRDYDQAGLDAQYNNRRRFPHYIDYFDKWKRWSAETRQNLKCHLDVPFGDSAAETLDIFPAEDADAPIFVFVHGGYWYSLDKADFSYVAEGMAAHGVTTVVNNYALAPGVGMDEIVRQNRAAFAWLWEHGRDYGADPTRIYACGHSAGGHLVNMVMATDWADFGAAAPDDLIKGACLISGIYDLEPIQLCYLNDKLGMDAQCARRNSPLLQTYRAPAPLMIVLGKDESEDYHRQGNAMADFWKALGYPAEVVVPEVGDHFTIADSLRDPNSDLVRAQLRDMP